MTNHRRDNDARGSDAAHKRWLEGIASGVTNIEAYQQAIQEEKPTLTSFTVRCDPDDEKGVLLVLKGYIGSKWYVAFHGDTTITMAMSGAGNRLRNGSLKWKEDDYANNSS